MALLRPQSLGEAVNLFSLYFDQANHKPDALFPITAEQARGKMFCHVYFAGAKFEIVVDELIKENRIIYIYNNEATSDLTEILESVMPGMWKYSHDVTAKPDRKKYVYVFVKKSDRIKPMKFSEALKKLMGDLKPTIERSKKRCISGIEVVIDQ